jgi:hypothetical protein
MFSVDHEPRLMAAVPLADGLDDDHCLNSPHNNDPMETQCDAPTRVCGASMRRSIRYRTFPPSATCASPTCTLYERDRGLARAA